MPNPHDVAECVGNLRRESFTRRIALGTLAPPELKLEIVEIDSVSFYNEDLETGNPPAEWTRLCARVKRADAGLFQSLVFLNVPTMQQPEAYAGGVATLVDEKGDISNDGTRDCLATFLKAFAAWIEVQRRS